MKTNKQSIIVILLGRGGRGGQVKDEVIPNSIKHICCNITHTIRFVLDRQNMYSNKEHEQYQTTWESWATSQSEALARVEHCFMEIQYQLRNTVKHCETKAELQTLHKDLMYKHTCMFKLPTKLDKSNEKFICSSMLTAVLSGGQIVNCNPAQINAVHIPDHDSLPIGW